MLRRSTLLLALGFATSPVVAQSTIDTLDGANAGDRFGTSVAFVGDLDHDGSIDFAVGAPGFDHGFGDEGSVTVFSGADRSVLFTWFGATPDARLGYSVDGVGDIDLDGTDDVIAGAPGASQALVWSGATGAILFDIAVGATGEFGNAVCGIGLADADGWPDFAVGGTAGNGLSVFSGRTG